MNNTQTKTELLQEIRDYLSKGTLKDSNGAWPQWYVGIINAALSREVNKPVEAKTIKDVVTVDKAAAKEVLSKLVSQIDDMNGFMMRQMFAAEKKYSRDPSIETLIELARYKVLMLLFESEGEDENIHIVKGAKMLYGFGHIKDLNIDKLVEREIEVTDKNHPHFGETGYIVSEEYPALKMVKIRGDYNYFFADHSQIKVMD